MAVFPNWPVKSRLSGPGHRLRQAVAWLLLATLHVGAQQAPPILLTHPADSEVMERSPAMFQVEANGTAPRSYQWRRNGYDMPGETVRRLILDRTRISDNASRFDVVVSNPDGVVTSQVAVLTVRRDAARQVVIFYDDVSGLYNYGRLYVNQFRNLLGHFHVDVEARNVAAYQTGDMDGFDVAFYIGSAFDAPLPASFLADASIPGRSLVWINYNIWKLLASGYDVAHLGFSYEGFVNGYNRVAYKGEDLYKGTYDFQAVRIAATGVDQVYAEMYSATDPSKPRHPYALRSGSFWYFADNCFTDDVDVSRSLVLADLLHEILDTGAGIRHRALVRIEDINAYYTSTAEVLAIADLLQSRGIRASFGVIPRYISARDCAEPDDCVDITMSDDPVFQAMLADVVDKGHILLVHGYTHNNVEEGDASGPGYEFWNHAENRPLLTDRWEFASDRVLAARAEFRAAGLPALIWETPHYEASLVANHAIAEIYSDWYERLRPYNIFSDGLSPEIVDAIAMSSPSPAFQTQYLPYTSYQSVYGTKVVPENLNFFSDDWVDSYGNTMNIPNKLMYARHLKVVRDGVASFYFHPYLDISILETFLDGMEANGYEFTDAETLLAEMPVGWSPTPTPPAVVAPPEDLTVAENAVAVLTAAASGSEPLDFQWRHDGVPIIGANGTSLTLDPVLGTDHGLIDVVVENAYGSVTSTPARLAITYSVTYHGNDATDGTVPASQTKTHDVPQALAVNSGDLARTGYHFSGWNTAADGSGTDYVAAGTYSANASVTLYARWMQVIISHGEAVDAPALTWTTGGSAVWFGQTNVTYDGVDAAQSGAITNGQQSWLETAVNGPGSLGFWWKVSSEADSDYLAISANGVEQAGRISGETGWQHKEVFVPGGKWSLRWFYTKDAAGSSGTDCGWVDQVVWRPKVVDNDYGGDGAADLTVFDAGSGTWYARSIAGDVHMLADTWGFTGVVAVAGDYDGDRKGDLAVYHPVTGQWYIRSLNGTILAWGLKWGFDGAVAVPGDYNGDGRSDLAVYDPATGTWYIRSLNGTVLAWGLNWGFDGVWPVPGDFNADGRSDMAVYNPVTGGWYIRSLDGSVIAWDFIWGYQGAIPVGAIQTE